MKVGLNIFVVLFALCMQALTSCNNGGKDEQKVSEEVKEEFVENPNVEGFAEEERLIVPFVQKLQTTHKSWDMKEKEAVQFDFKLSMGGKERMNAKITMTPNMDRIRIDKEGGTSLVYNGEDVFLSPKNAMYDMARFDMFTWPYFFAAPYKFDDPGTRWDVMGRRQLKGKEYQVARLTFDEGTGDTPEDWYMVYVEPISNRLEAMAYIVTYNNNPDSAKQNPHAITYEDYQQVDNIPIATTWKFWNWDQQQGLGEQLGEAKITNISFVPKTDRMFKQSDNSEKVDYGEEEEKEKIKENKAGKAIER